jgi:4-amino-4-deoxy-L-arabinose transferase-like glycosyltransferase
MCFSPIRTLTGLRGLVLDRSRWSRFRLRPKLCSRLADAAAAVLVLYAALLRFDALVTKYDFIAASPRVEAAQHRLKALGDRVRPAGLQWSFEGARHGDPVSYLKIARAKQGFYGASAREPLPLATIQAFLYVTADQDIAVSCASALYSTLLVLAAYLLAARACSRGVGLAVASLLAVDAWLIHYGVDGWRDDAFAFFVAMTAHGLLRLRSAPSAGRASIAGVFAAAACLTRLTAISFVVPALALVAVDGPREVWRKRAACVGLALAVTLALIAPFLVNNWVAFGDPFYSLDFATEFYRGRGGLPVNRPVAWAGVFADRIAAHPLATVDSLLRGLTVYPFGNKWAGLVYLSPAVPAVLRASAIIGLMLLLTFADGRLLVGVLLTALIPFAVIWQTPGGSQWRLTEFAYPFYLIAACRTLHGIFRLSSRDTRHRLAETLRHERRRWTIGALTAAVGLAAAVFLPRWWQYVLVREAALTDGAFAVVAGPADRWFFGPGWYPPVLAGNVSGRYSHGPRATLFVPVFERRGTLLTFRMQACSAQTEPAREVRVSIDGTWVSTLHVVWNPKGAESYEVVVPEALLHEGWNTIDLEADGSTVMPFGESRFLGLEAGQESAFFFWYVRVASEHGG